MPSTIEEIEGLIGEAITTGFRGRLLERGLARSMIWVDGELPEGAPQFSERLSYDLLSYGYALLSLALRLRELGGNEILSKAAFEKAAAAITDVLHNGDPENSERGFHKVLAASAYHLGGFSAKAFSLIHGNIMSVNLSRMEVAISQLMLRRFSTLEESIIEWKYSGEGSDTSISTWIETEIGELGERIGTDLQPEDYGITSIELPAVDLALTDNYYSSILEFLFALETGEQQFVDQAIERIQNSLDVCAEMNLLPQWWVLRITKHLISDLWQSSFHQVIPPTPLHGDSSEWENLRWLYIASLFKRNKSEIDLWPSQLDGAKRAVDESDDLVISLPTSAGKTRIAELCILRCLSLGKRVLFITPLRALSAQTESSLRKTFLPLGKSVSSLYGSIGTSDFEQDVLKSRDIVVGTPEKLDFAIRNDPTVIDDVGLIILDEGHMIGLNEREINYEVQIQRLLKREDSHLRRIVCLSAILPDGDQFEDFVGWLRQDKEGQAITSDWRPTDLRFGEIFWHGTAARIDFTIGDEQPFIPNYIQPFVPPLRNPGLRTTSFPNNAQELTLAAAWRLTEDNHTVLIYCPQRSSVDALATRIIDLHKRGALNSVLSVPEQNLELAKVLGQEWLGENHPIVECLDIGVAVHHGALPTAFRKEMEKLLQQGALKITVSSPTLAQGLNLSATAVIVHSLYRSGDLIDVSEFKNVIGRAGRAFVDTHGLVLHPIFDKHAYRKMKWRGLVNDANARNMESGLFLLVLSFVNRMAASLQTTTITDVLDYVTNNATAWNSPHIENETVEQSEEQKVAWDKHLVNLDTALLSLLGEEDIPIGEIPDKLDEILQSSLWQRRLNRRPEAITLFNSVLSQRAQYIWSCTTANQRRGYFLAGVGLDSGQRLDLISDQANLLLVSANAYIAANELPLAIATISELAELIFDIPPFVPHIFPNDWKGILNIWLRGEQIGDNTFLNAEETLRFIEDGLVYRLPWGIEAIRVRAQANGDVIADGATIDDFELGLAVPSIENGTLNRSAALLMQAGFNSRKAAIYAVESTNASFTSSRGLKTWLKSDQVLALTRSLTWPTLETSSLWISFVKEYRPQADLVWDFIESQLPATWLGENPPDDDTIVRIVNQDQGTTKIISPDGEQIGELSVHYNLLKNGAYSAKVKGNGQFLDALYCGDSKNPFTYTA